MENNLEELSKTNKLSIKFEHSMGQGQISSVILKRNYPKNKTSLPPNPFNPITQTVGQKSQQKEMCI